MSQKILHITPNTKGYEEATLISNAIDDHNHLRGIEIKGKFFMTGGFIINDTPAIRKVLDAMPIEEQYEFIKSFKMDPWERQYLPEGYLSAQEIKEGVTPTGFSKNIERALEENKGGYKVGEVIPAFGTKAFNQMMSKLFGGN